METRGVLYKVSERSQASHVEVLVVVEVIPADIKVRSSFQVNNGSVHSSQILGELVIQNVSNEGVSKHSISISKLVLSGIWDLRIELSEVGPFICQSGVSSD